MSASRQTAEAAIDLGALEAVTVAVEAGDGLPDVVRAAARALDASLILIDRSSSVLAVAARSSADERALMADVPGVATHELRVGDAVVGRLRVRGRSAEPSPALLRIVTTLIAGEVERVRAPERASEAAQEAFLRAVLHRDVTDRGDIVARAAELGVDLAAGGGRDRRARAPLRARPRTTGASGCSPPPSARRAPRRRARSPRSTTRAGDTAGQVARARAGGGGRRRPPRGRGGGPRAPRHPARLHVRRRALARGPGSGRPLPRGQRGAAGRQRRRGRPAGDGARPMPRPCWPSRRPAPTGCCCRR